MPKDPRYPLSVIAAALDAAGVEDEQRDRVFRELSRHGPRIGRKPVNDSALLIQVLDLLAERRMTVRAACVVVTIDLPDSLRNATFRRVYRKALYWVKWWALAQQRGGVPPPPMP